MNHVIHKTEPFDSQYSSIGEDGFKSTDCSLLLPLRLIEQLNHERKLKLEQVVESKINNTNYSPPQNLLRQSEPELPIITEERSLGKRAVRVFSSESLAHAQHLLMGCSDKQKRITLQKSLIHAANYNGFRTLPGKAAEKKLIKLTTQFENLVEPISYLADNLLLGQAGQPEYFRIEPILLVGQPGMGKTYFASKLAEVFDSNWQVFSAGSAQAAFQLSGMDIGWSGATAGLIFNLLSQGRSATPILLIDEVDKISNCDRHPIIPTLLELLEVKSATRFKDLAMQLNFDASRMVVILTASNIAQIPTPLLSRVKVFHVPEPDQKQRLRIINTEILILNKSTGKNIRLKRSTIQVLADNHRDLRELVRRVRECYIEVLTDGQKRLSSRLVPHESPVSKVFGEPREVLLVDYRTLLPRVGETMH